MRAFSLLALVIVSLSHFAAHADERKTPYAVAATVGMVADIVEHIAQDRAKIRTLMGPGVDPHLYKPTRGDVAALMSADIVFYSGLHLEGKMIDALTKVGATKPVLAATETIPLNELLAVADSPGHYDPHVWMDPSLWAHAAKRVADALSDFDPKNAPTYQSNAKRYIEECRQLTDYGKSVFATVPKEKRVLISSHDAFQYFGRAFDIEVRGIQGISTESEAGLQTINGLVELIATRRIPAVFVESSVPTKSVEALVFGVDSRGSRVAIGGELFSDAMGPANSYEGTYAGMIDHNITTVARALGGNAPEKGKNGKLK